MTTRLALWWGLFAEYLRILLKNSDFAVAAPRCASGVEELKVKNSCGHLVILPWMGQMIWDAQFNGHDPIIRNMFSQPKPAAEVVATCGCFAFHSSLLADGYPSLEDSYPLHGEMTRATIDETWLELEGEDSHVGGHYKYMMGLGHHYQAHPTMVMYRVSALFDIQTAVTNLVSVVMPLQYMCHMNYAYVLEATFSQNISDEAMKLHESIPTHVRPTEQWLVFNQRIVQDKTSLVRLNESYPYDLKIVSLANQSDRCIDKSESSMIAPDGTIFIMRFSSTELNYVTRWILYNGGQQVATFALPAACRLEGSPAAQYSGTLIEIELQHTRTFTITTGIA